MERITWPIAKRHLVLLGRILLFALRKFLRDHCLTSAQALTFTTIFSLIPVLAIAFTLFQLFGGLSQLESLVFDYLSEILTPGGQQRVLEIIKGLVARAQGAPIGSLSTLVLVVLAFFLLIEIEQALNGIWQADRKRPLWSKVMVYWTMFTLGPILMAIPLIIMLLLTTSPSMALVAQYLPLRLIRAIPYLSSWAFLWGTYFFMPSVRVKATSATVGALMGGVLWQVAAKAYTVYSANILTYSKLYGSLGTIPLFMLWLFVTWGVVLYGAEVSYCFQNRSWLLAHGGADPEAAPAAPEVLGLRMMTLVAWHFAGGTAPVPLGTLARQMNTSQAQLYRLARPLVGAGLVVREEGTGHFLPARPLDQISLVEVVRVFRPPYPAQPVEVAGVDATLRDLLSRATAAYDRSLAAVDLDRVLKAVAKQARAEAEAAARPEKPAAEAPAAGA
ncbi:YihY family inner membrane protein [Dissulfurirhabdus thermomarina]|uniref:YihY family inner membrane protein n=1 Tax=Dissulfurirhabdus thermomarina TaxID=1765737 RepID=A0A6N9TN15_DISTH|nr:YhjD/YihY/BrkB family envelope integrity protein [Dissulfurirhabdus thermomarina]NDY42635.1 YihY family inner membrane protein [Dissulfurirhabdus thermomarina]NMX22681.1 YihY family inner membrane protein [Dissulfurirhabdus thermomarina]